MKFLGLGKAPAWSPFKNAGEHDRFMSEVRRAIERRALPLEESEEEGVLVSSLNADHHFGLMNLAQLCATLERGDWAEAIEHHLGGVLKAASATHPEEFTLEDVRDQLKLRLYPTDMPHLEAAVTYPSPPGLTIALTLDQPNQVVTVRREDAYRWGVADEELYRLGLENVWEEGRLTFEPHDAQGALLRIANGQSFFTASHCLMLDRYVLDEPPLGLIVSVPTRHLVVYHEIGESGLAFAVSSMLRSGAGLFEQGPGSVSPHLYWLRKNEWTSLTHVSDNSLLFDPPQEFTDEVARPLGLE